MKFFDNLTIQTIFVVKKVLSPSIKPFYLVMVREVVMKRIQRLKAHSSMNSSMNEPNKDA